MIFSSCRKKTRCVVFLTVMLSYLSLLSLCSCIVSAFSAQQYSEHRIVNGWVASTRVSIQNPPCVQRRYNYALRMSAALDEEKTVQKQGSSNVNDGPSPPVVTTTMTELSLPSEEEQEDLEAEYRRGLLTIGFITLLFSSNSPALHAALADGSSPPPVLFLNAAVSAVALSGLVFGGGKALESSTPLPSSLLRNSPPQQEENKKNNLELKAGLELGVWKFLGTTANLYGLSLTTADHGAFLIQLTTLIVPVVQGIMGVPIPKRIQFAVAIALAGVFLFTQDTTSVDSAVNSDTVLLGDGLCVVAAGFYATYDLRLFEWGKLVSPRNLITNKIATQALLSVLLLAAVGRDETKDFVYAAVDGEQTVSWIVLPAILWSGVAVNAVAPFLQVGGQQAVGPSRAQTLYASQPLWASIISYVCLGETVGLQGLVGGIAFLAALALAVTAEAPDPYCEEDPCEV